ncbi:hypothetical protein DSO57_1006579 [Entomophthora muscae]|uniref:Uncharacterized protein n=1 Tax=Entomophthora muscae TaxID=34485 RepID=A0ACC2TV66_9FUNG|nr:hypothetical protein DSO57_1006579 [Entomophthora muscae]
MKKAEAFADSFLSTQKLKLIAGYSMIDQGFMDQGMKSISSSYMPVHFPSELLDLMLCSGHYNVAAQLWKYFELCQITPEVKDPKGLIAGLLRCRISEAHRFLDSYHGGLVSQKEAIKFFFAAALGDAHISKFLKSLLLFYLNLRRRIA